MKKPGLITIAELAKILNVHKTTARRLFHQWQAEYPEKELAYKHSNKLLVKISGLIEIRPELFLSTESKQLQIISMVQEKISEIEKVIRGLKNQIVLESMDLNISTKKDNELEMYANLEIADTDD